MAVNINVPSQVKTYANLAAFPATGALKTIYIAEDTNKTYRWTGSVYVEVSGADFSGYVPTSRTLTINGTTQDLSADRTFTISTGITIGTTAIASGTVGRVLFEGTGNVVQESANLFWDNTNGRLGIGTSSPTAPLQITTSGLVTALYINTGNDGGFTAQNNGTLAVNRTTQVRLVNGSTIFGSNDRTYQLVNIGKGTTDADFYVQYWNGASYLERFRVFSTGNVSIGTTTDAGFKLDVNGTARIDQTLRLNATGTGELIRYGTAGRVTIDGLWIRHKSNNAQDMININNNFVGINQTTDIPSAILAINSTNRGFLPPQMTNTQKLAIASPATGLVVYDTTLNKLCVRTASSWETITSL